MRHNGKALAKVGIESTKADESTAVSKYTTVQKLPSAPLLSMQCCGLYFCSFFNSFLNKKYVKK